MITWMPRIPARLVAIGNSRGVRLPKALIEQAGLGDDLELEVVDDGIVIRGRRRRRDGWADAARSASAGGEAALPEVRDLPETSWMRKEWRWE